MAYAWYEMTDAEIKELRKRMTPEQKLNAMSQLYWSAREMKAGYLRSTHPEWSEERVQKEVRDAFIRARS